MSAQRILISLLCLSLTACAFSKDQEKKKNAAIAQTVDTEVRETVEKLTYSGELTKDNVRVQFVEGEDPGYYHLEITWAEEVPAMKVSVNGYAYTIVNRKNSFSATVTDNTKLEIHLVALNALGGESSTYALTTHSPVDKVIEKDLPVEKDTLIEVNRLYIRDEGRILTNGNNLTIITNKLYVENEIDPTSKRMSYRDAQIITTTPKTPARGIDQLKGSTIKLYAKKAIGHLRVAMVGLDGIDGQDGRDGISGAPGVNGSDGKIRNVAPLCVDDRGRPCRQGPQVECEVAPTNGSPGQAGTPGLDGEAGSRGGNSGSLTVMIQDSSEFKLEVAQQRGRGGRGGLGGKGGSGGPGGKAGLNPQGRCATAQDGPQGPRGSDGKPGPEGAMGLLDDVITDVKTISRYEID